MEAYSLFIKVQEVLPDFHNMEPETIKETLKLTDVELDKLFACQAIFNTNTVFTDWHVFEKVVVSVNDVQANFEYMQEVTPAEVTWGVKVIRMIDVGTPFSEEVLAYIATVFHREGFVLLPESIRQEKGNSGLSVEYFLKDMNKNNILTPQAKKIQQDMLARIDEYVKYRYEQTKKDLGIKLKI
jgi:hypothetical protein